MTMDTEYFKNEVDALWARTKAGELPREARFQAIEELTERYVIARGESPPPAQLDRLATLCLYEEVTDPNVHKMLHEAEPVMSDTQYGRRKKREWDREEISVGPAHVTGKRMTTYKDDNETLKVGKTTYYLR